MALGGTPILEGLPAGVLPLTATTGIGDRQDSEPESRERRLRHLLTEPSV